MLIILLCVILGIYLSGLFLFGGLLLVSLVGSRSSWSEISETLMWILIWPSWVPRIIWYMWGNDFMRDA